jgi:catechol 2,3-dioxygenase-like lactoylglutathione lyase family enzyme
MSRLFGPIIQYACVVPDIDAAMHYWTDVLGVGPFFVQRSLLIENLMLRGKTGPAQMHMALSHSGGVQIELIQPIAGKSLYGEFLDEGNVGAHHVAYLADYAAAKKSADQQGLALLMEGRFGDIRFAYYRSDVRFAFPFVELISADGSFILLQKKVADAAAGWAGEHPIRDFASLT